MKKTVVIHRCLYILNYLLAYLITNLLDNNHAVLRIGLHSEAEKGTNFLSCASFLMLNGNW